MRECDSDSLSSWLLSVPFLFEQVPSRKPRKLPPAPAPRDALALSPVPDMLYRAALIALAASADALSIGVGDKFPAPGLSKLGCSGKKV